MPKVSVHGGWRWGSWGRKSGQRGRVLGSWGRGPGLLGRGLLRQLGGACWGSLRGCWGSQGGWSVSSFMRSQDFSGWSFHLGLCGLPHSMGALRQSAYMTIHSSNTGVPEKVAEVVSPCRPGLQSHAASLPCALWVQVTEVSRDASRGNGKQLQPVGGGGLNNWIPVVKPSLSHPSENGSL